MVLGARYAIVNHKSALPEKTHIHPPFTEHQKHTRCLFHGMQRINNIFYMMCFFLLNIHISVRLRLRMQKKWSGKYSDD